MNEYVQVTRTSIPHPLEDARPVKPLSQRELGEPPM